MIHEEDTVVSPNEAERNQHQPDFDAYEELYKNINTIQPHHQGLLAEEFTRSIADPRVIKTSLEIDNREIAIPQLGPVSQYGWLYDEFFADRYPAEVDAGALLHFADLRGVEPSDEVIRGIQALAAKNGILVFDYSSVEPDYPDRVQRVLETAGVKAGTIEELGTQTYFAGDVHFKREHEQRKPHLSFTDAFEYMKENGLVSDDVYRNGVTVDAVVDGRDADVLYDLFFRAYGTISKHPCKQALGPEELRGMLSDRNIAKVVYRRDGVAETVCLITNNIDELTWINPIYYQSNYPQKYANRQVVWFPGIATDPDPGKMGHNVPKIIDRLAEVTEIADNEFVVVFDTPDINKEFLPAYLDAEINRQPQVGIDFRELGSQRYVAVHLSNAA